MIKRSLKSSVTELSLTLFFYLLPRRHVRHARKMINLILQQIQAMICSYRFPVFSAILSAICLWKTSASGPTPPLTENTNGVKVPCSTCMILSLKFLFVSFSCFCRILSIIECCCEVEFVFVTRTSKNAFWQGLQAPLARMPGLASLPSRS